MAVYCINTDGGSRGNPGPAATGVTITDESGVEVYCQGKTMGVATNNEAEYTAFINSLEWVLENTTTITQLTWQLDSKLVVEQLNGNWKVKEQRLKDFCQQIHQALKTVSFSYQIKYVPREQNQRADELVNQALDA